MSKRKYALNSKEQIIYNGQTYHLRIKSDSLDNPVVLFLHGGAGSPDRPMTMKYQAPLAEYCTIVAWDQRGAGEAYNKKTAKNEVLTMDLYIEDTHNVIMYLKERFNQSKIIIVGHSFGSILGVLTAQKYPEDIQAYVGVGQAGFPDGEKVSYEFTVNEAVKRNHKKAIKRLEKLGAPVNGKYKDGKVFLQRNYLCQYGGIVYGFNRNYLLYLLRYIPLMLTEYSLLSLLNFPKYSKYCLNQPVAREDSLLNVRELNVPVYLLLGHHDYNCPFELAEKWFNDLKAPFKELVWFEKSAHEPQWEEPGLWNKEFVSRVLKL